MGVSGLGEATGTVNWEQENTKQKTQAVAGTTAGGNLNGVVAIAAGDTFALALKADGTVWTWGSNTYGQLGIGSTVQQPQAVKVTGLMEVAQIVAGATHSVGFEAGRNGPGLGEEIIMGSCTTVRL